MNTMNNKQFRKMYALEFDVEFTEGLCAGAGSFGNRIQLARNGRGELVLHGTAIAGVLRHAFESFPEMEPGFVNKFFGSAHGVFDENAEGLPSLLKVEDAVFSVEKINSQERVSHLRSRHTGSVADGALYSIEAIPPKAETHFSLTFAVTDDFPEDSYPADRFLKTLATLFQTGLVFGGNANRGVGRAKVNGAIVYKEYNLASLDGMAAWLDDDYARRSGRRLVGGKPLETDSNTADTLRVTWDFIIPQGQDILVADGKGLDAEAEPHRVTGADGKDYWLLPGSTLRGLFRSESARLAAREGKKIADSHDRYAKNGPAKGDELGWLFAEDQKDNAGFLKTLDDEYPVESMFGSLHKAGRLHLCDGLSPIGTDKKSMASLAVDPNFPVQYRVHVAVDPISGGAIEGALYDNYVLTAGGGQNTVRFPITMILRQPKEDEVRWLAQTLRAIHTGLLRIGSSKSAGRLVVANDSLKAEGTFANLFDDVCVELTGMSHSVAGEVSAVPSPESPKNQEPLPAENVIPALEGKLHVIKKGNNTTYKVSYTTPKGKPMNMQPLPDKARCFADKDAEEGAVVKIILDKGQFKEVTIPGKSQIVPKISSSPNSGPVRSGHGNSSQKPTDTNKLPKANPSILGMPFHNPYTFIPFEKIAPKRKEVTPLSIDEIEKDRFSGILEVELENISPLLISEGWCQEAKECVRRAVEVNTKGHKIYEIQKISQDVILPATGVRGFLRNLMTIVTGGPLSVLEEETYLCQGRDLPLTPLSADKSRAPAILARIIKPGNSLKSGVIEIGETILVKEQDLQYIYGRDLPRPKPHKQITWLWAKMRGGQLLRLSEKQDQEHTAQVKLSGRPVNTKGEKKEGVFLKPLCKVELPSSYWAAYNSRYRHGDHPELQRGDLVWIEPIEIGMTCQQVQSERDIASLQWARWGRCGVKIGKVMPNHLLPDSHREDALVAQVTDLFGQVPIRKGSLGKTFKGRVMPGNLVFNDAASNTEKAVPLAVMGMPHLGCVPFYRNNSDPNKLCTKDSLRGYKVYRTEKSGKAALPWRFETQGGYAGSGRLESNPRQSVNISAELLNPHQKGTVSISLHALSQEELALILYLCQGIWRLGGGKPIGLGVCRVLGVRLWDESGSPIDPASCRMEDETVKKRFDLWMKTQKPIDRLRYPRATTRNNNKNTRGGMTWFQKCAAVKKGGDKNNEKVPGLEPIYVCDDLMEKARQNGAANASLGFADLISGQMLPFHPETPETELLYGYDAFFCDRSLPDDPAEIKNLVKKPYQFNRAWQDCYPDIVPFDESKHITGSEKAGENLSQNRKARQQSKRDRQ